MPVSASAGASLKYRLIALSDAPIAVAVIAKDVLPLNATYRPTPQKSVEAYIHYRHNYNEFD